MSQKISIMGHAGLFIEGGGERVIVDPILHTEPIASNTVVHSYPRHLNLVALPPPTLIVLTHGHLDHFDPRSLELLDRHTPVLLPHDPALAHGMASLGFGDLRMLAPWETHVAGGLRLTGVPSHAGVEEWGLVVESGGAKYLHLADCEPALADARRIRETYGRMEAASIKFQPAAPAHGVMRGLGAHFEKSRVTEWLDCVAEVDPLTAFPYASGVRYTGRHAWLNRYAFPFRGEEIVRLMRKRLGGESRVGMLHPGDVVHLSPGGSRVEQQTCPFVSRAEDDEGEPVWAPFDETTLAGLGSAEERAELEERFELLLRDEVAPWIAYRAGEQGSPIRRFMDFGVVYQLTIHTGGARNLEYAVDFRGPLRVTAERHPEANYFAHVAGGSLLSVLRGESGPELFYMSGDVRLYEKLIEARNDGFWWPETQGWDLFESLPEPVTHYLRHTRDAH